VSVVGTAGERWSDRAPYGFAELLELERIEDNLFRGWCHDGRPQHAFGGHVAAQALAAAGLTVPAERGVHSLHGYFVRPGRTDRSIVYSVDRTRDGRSFTTRRVSAVQDGEVIFTLSASFQRPEPGSAHQSVMPAAPPPDQAAEIPFGRWTSGFAAVELRLVTDAPAADPGRGPRQQMWVRAREPLGDNQLLNVCALTYTSDIRLALTATLWQGTDGIRHVRITSLDHAVWVHRPFGMDEWLLFDMESPSSAFARGLVRGEFYTRDGALVASVVQEVLIRPR
jgi:acyl-CoA thioesterase-2